MMWTLIVHSGFFQHSKQITESVTEWTNAFILVLYRLVCTVKRWGSNKIQQGRSRCL